MTDELVAVRTFESRIDADMAKEILEQQGIQAYVSADDAGGLDPALQLVQGARVIVRQQDLEEASRVLVEAF
jgi:hypothetical protein